MIRRKDLPHHPHPLLPRRQQRQQPSPPRKPAICQTRSHRCCCSSAEHFPSILIAQSASFLRCVTQWVRERRFDRVRSRTFEERRELRHVSSNCKMKGERWIVGDEDKTGKHH